MAMGARIPMPTDLTQLTLMQWLSPGYPVGAFAYSHGLEQVVTDGVVTDAATFESWLRDILDHGAGCADAILLHAAHRAGSDRALDELDALALALAPSSERRIETELQGAAFAGTTAALTGRPAPPRAYPVAVGAAAREAGIDAVPAAAAYLHAFAANLTSAAIRLVPLGQTEGQRVLAGLNQLCQKLAEDTAALGPEEIGSSSFAADIASMRHETLYSRQFRS